MIIEKFGLYFVIFVSYQVKIIQVQFLTAVSGIRRGMGNLTELNRRITDLKMAGSTNTTAEIRRDSNSTVSTYYGSMKSADLYSSRRSSQVSQVRLSYTLHAHSSVGQQQAPVQKRSSVCINTVVCIESTSIC